MTANNLDRAMPLEAGDDKREGRRGSLLLPFPSKIKMARPSADRQEKMRILEALLFAAPRARPGCARPAFCRRRGHLRAA